jgi:hypothetical protein
MLSLQVYHWQSEHECDICMMLLRHILVVLCEMFSVTPIMSDGQVEEDPLYGLHARHIFICGDTSSY